MNSINFKKLIEKTGYIILHTPSEDPSRRWNGGAYSFTIDFNLVEPDKVRISYSTSSEFSFCSVFGFFGDCKDCPYNERVGFIWRQPELGECYDEAQECTAENIIPLEEAEKLFIEKIGNGYEIIEPIEALDIIFKEEVVEA